MPYGRRFRSYVNLPTTEAKIRRIIREFPVTTCREYLFGSAGELPHKKPALNTIVNPQLMASCAGNAGDHASVGRP